MVRAKIIMANGRYILGKKGKSVASYKSWAKSYNRYNKDKVKVISVKDRKPAKRPRRTGGFFAGSGIRIPRF